MKIVNQTEDQFSITLSTAETWFLAKQFGPGWIFGVEDPTSGLSETALNTFEKEAFESLSEAGILKMNASNQMDVDELIGGMMYSCLHSSQILVVKCPDRDEVIHFYFLPEWQMQVVRDGEEGYQFTVYQSRDAIFPALMAQLGIEPYSQDGQETFILEKKILEMAADLISSDQSEQAKKLLSDADGDQAELLEFVKMYTHPDFHLVMDMIYDRDDSARIHSVRNELLQIEHGLFWGVYAKVPDSADENIQFKSLSVAEAEKRFLMMLA